MVCICTDSIASDGGRCSATETGTGDRCTSGEGLLAFGDIGMGDWRPSVGLLLVASEAGSEGSYMTGRNTTGERLLYTARGFAAGGTL